MTNVLWSKRAKNLDLDFLAVFVYFAENYIFTRIRIRSLVSEAIVLGEGKGRWAGCESVDTAAKCRQARSASQLNARRARPKSWTQPSFSSGAHLVPASGCCPSAATGKGFAHHFPLRSLGFGRRRSISTCRIWSFALRGDPTPSSLPRQGDLRSNAADVDSPGRCARHPQIGWP
jgi:hypothetical protein